jgi:hypothetical protein
MRRRTLTQQTVRCPEQDCTARLTVRSDLEAAPSRRHRALVACSLRPSVPLVTPAAGAFFADLAPDVRYRGAVGGLPYASKPYACSEGCLAILNAAEGGGEPVRCSSGVSDSLELARQTQSPRTMRLLWFYSA